MNKYFDNSVHVPAFEIVPGFYPPENDADFPVEEAFTEPLELTSYDLTDYAAVDVEEIARMRRMWERVKGFAGHNKGKLALGAFAVSTALTFSSHSYHTVEHDLTAALPWVGSGVVASETAFVVGAGMMAAAVGSKVGSPLKIKERIPEIAERANDSLLFKSGFWVNTTGAVGTAAIVSAGVVAKLPPESWGVLPIAFADMGLTTTVRLAMHRGIRNNVQRRQAELAEHEEVV